MLDVYNMPNTDDKGVTLKFCPAIRSMLTDLVDSGEYPTMTAAADAAIRQHYRALKGAPQ